MSNTPSSSPTYDGNADGEYEESNESYDRDQTPRPGSYTSNFNSNYNFLDPHVMEHNMMPATDYGLDRLFAGDHEEQQWRAPIYPTPVSFLGLLFSVLGGSAAGVWFPHAALRS